MWLIPGAHFQREHYARRPWVEGILRQCADPAHAFDNWMARDAGFEEEVARDTAARGLERTAVTITRLLRLASPGA